MKGGRRFCGVVFSYSFSRAALPLTFSSRRRRLRSTAVHSRCASAKKYRSSITHGGLFATKSSAATDSNGGHGRKGEEGRGETNATTFRPTEPATARARAGDFGLNERRSERRRAVHQPTPPSRWVGLVGEISLPTTPFRFSLIKGPLGKGEGGGKRKRTLLE